MIQKRKERKLHINIFHKLKCKNFPQNISRLNAAMYRVLKHNIKNSTHKRNN